MDNLFELYKRLARAIPMDARYGGQELASTSKYELRKRTDPRIADRRMQILLRTIKSNLHRFDLQQLSVIFYSTVKLRVPDRQLVN